VLLHRSETGAAGVLAGEPVDGVVSGAVILRLEAQVRDLAAHGDRIAVLAGDVLVVARVGIGGELSDLQVLGGVAQARVVLGPDHAVLFTPDVAAPAVVVPLADLARWPGGFGVVASAAAAEQPRLGEPARVLGGDP
jgi:hypothetical protein